MKLGSLTLTMVAALTACAPVPPAVVKVKAEPVQTTRCINLNQIAGRRVLADGSLLFEAVGRVDYRNRLASQCPGAARISRSAVISVVASSTESQLCRGDRVRVYDPVETSASSAPSCILADFDIVPRN